MNSIAVTVYSMPPYRKLQKPKMTLLSPLPLWAHTFSSFAYPSVNLFNNSLMYPFLTITIVTTCLSTGPLRKSTGQYSCSHSCPPSLSTMHLVFSTLFNHSIPLFKNLSRDPQSLIVLCVSDLIVIGLYLAMSAPRWHTSQAWNTLSSP